MRSIAVEAARSPAGLLTLRYRLEGDLSSIRLALPAPPHRRDELWKHSCFEAFVRPEGEQSYVELNLAPSGDWAAYRFSGYREGMRNADVAAPDVAVRSGEESFELDARIALAAELPPDRSWQLGLSAVIETVEGERSFWALAHAPGPPDFHHEHCFRLELPPA